MSYVCFTRETADHIASLREARKQAIGVLDYERAQALEAEIAETKSAAIEEYVNNIRENCRQSLIDCYHRYEVTLARVRSECDAEERDVRLRFHKQFQNLQNTQRAELVRAERELAEARNRENLRRVPELDRLIELSKKAAEAGQYDAAIALRNQSRDAVRDDLEKRLANVEADFIQNRQSLFEAFRKQIELLALKLENEIRKVEEKKRAKLQKEISNRENQMNITVQKAVGKIVPAGIPDPGRLLEADMVEVLEEIGCPLPAGRGESPQTKKTK